MTDTDVDSGAGTDLYRSTAVVNARITVGGDFCVTGADGSTIQMRGEDFLASHVPHFAWRGHDAPGPGRHWENTATVRATPAADGWLVERGDGVTEVVGDLAFIARFRPVSASEIAWQSRFPATALQILAAVRRGEMGWPLDDDPLPDLPQAGTEVS